MQRHCLWEELSSGAVLGHQPGVLSVFILIKLCELGKKQYGFFPQRRYVWEGQQVVRNTDGPLSSGKRSVPVALMWEMTPVGRLQGLKLLAGWRQPDGRERRPQRKERAGWELERLFQRRTWQVAQDGRWRWEGPGLQAVGSRPGRQVQTRRFLGTADELMLGVQDWVLGWDWREQKGEEPQRQTLSTWGYLCAERIETWRSG